MQTIQEILAGILTDAGENNWPLIQIMIAVDHRLTPMMERHDRRIKATNDLMPLVNEVFDHFADTTIDTHQDNTGARKLKALALFVTNHPSLDHSHSMRCCIDDGLLEF